MARALQIPFSLAFPIWVLVVSLLVLIRAGVIDFHHDNARGRPRRTVTSGPPATAARR